jgi:hypothetical protein
MSRPPRLLESVIVQPPDDPVVFSQRARWASAGTYMAHLSLLIVSGREDLKQKRKERGMAFPNTQLLFAPTCRRTFSRVDPLKHGHNAQPRGVQEQPGKRVRVGLQAVGDTHRYAAERFAASLVLAQALFRKEKGSLHLTLAREMALHHLTCAYLQAMLAVADEVGAEIIGRLMNQGRMARFGVEERQQINQVSELYLQRVREMLQRKEIVHDQKGVKPFGAGTVDPIR